MQIGQRFNPFKNFIGSFIPNSLMRCTDISAVSKLLWSRLAQYAGKDGACFPSLIQLAREIGSTKQVVIRSIQQLIDQKFIEKETPTASGQIQHKTNKYFFLYHEIFGKSGSIEIRPLGCLKDTPKGCLKDTPINKDKENQLRESGKRRIFPADSPFPKDTTEKKRTNHCNAICGIKSEFIRKGYLVEDYKKYEALRNKRIFKGFRFTCPPWLK